MRFEQGPKDLVTNMGVGSLGGRVVTFVGAATVLSVK